MAAYSENAAAVATVFVGNLPWTAKEEELRDHMQKAGTVLSVEIQSHEDTGRSKGWALVEYETADMANFAIQELHEKEFDGRNLNIRRDRSANEQLGGVTVFVGNLPWSCKDADLESLFAQFNPVDAHVKTFQTGKSRGFGIVRLPDQGTAMAAIQSLNGYNMDERAIEVREERPRSEAPRRKNNRNAVPTDAAAAVVNVAPKAPIEPSNTLYVSNLAWSSTDHDLFQHFSTAGAVPVSATIQMNDKTQRSKGWGLVEFNSIEEADQVRNALNRSELDGRSISVRFDAARD